MTDGGWTLGMLLSLSSRMSRGEEEKWRRVQKKKEFDECIYLSLDVIYHLGLGRIANLLRVSKTRSLSETGSSVNFETTSL